jgi:heme oxygenase
MLDTSGSSRILQGRAKHGTDVQPNKNQRAQKPKMSAQKPRRRNSARKSGLALALKEGTRKSHSVAENSQFMIGFFKGLTSRTAWSDLVASLYYVYKVMEEAFDYTKDTNVQSMDFPELRRVPSLEDDMAYYFGPNWKNEIVPSRATRIYCNRIQTIAQEKPHLLLAHMYTRYLGDLFGGQMLKGMARTSLKLEAGKGTRFYEFDEISHIKKFIETWSTTLNELDLTDEQKEEIVEEANRVFVLNIGIFEELGGSKMGFLRALSRLFRSGIAFALSQGKDKMQASFS